MVQFFSSFYPHMVIGLMLLFAIVLGSLCIEDAFRGGRS
jgi:hypothetical protein